MAPIVAIADVDICNMALSHLGISGTVVSLNPPDQSPTAQACGFWYAKCRNQLLQSAPWNFAYKYEALTPDGSVLPGSGFGETYAFPGWRFAYQLPIDCIQAVQVVTRAGIRFGAQYWNNWWSSYPQQIYAIPKIPFKIFESTARRGELCIACDISSVTEAVYLFYINAVENTALFDPMFIEALSYEIGSKIGGRLRADAQKVQYCVQMAQSKRLEALAQHLNAAQQDRERASPSITTR